MRRLFSVCKHRKSMLAALLVALLVISAWPGVAKADEKGISLQEAIQIARQIVAVPAGYTEFSSQYYSSDRGPRWELIWKAPGDAGGSFRVAVDGVTGEVVSLDSWKPEQPGGGKFGVPAISREEAQKKAAQFLQKAVPKKMAALYMVPGGNQLIPITNYGMAFYNIKWERRYQGIPVNGDGAYVNVDMKDGQIVSYSLNWSDIDLIAPNGIISGEQAGQSFSKEGMLKLTYLISRDEKNQEQKPLLVYQIYHPSNGVIDAFTGLPLALEEGSWLSAQSADYGGMGGMARAEEIKSKTPLTPQEVEEVEGVAGLISQEEAVAAALKKAAAAVITKAAAAVTTVTVADTETIINLQNIHCAFKSLDCCSGLFYFTAYS